MKFGSCRTSPVSLEKDPVGVDEYAPAIPAPGNAEIVLLRVGDAATAIILKTLRAYTVSKKI
jgi:hypothetical protein